MNTKQRGCKPKTKRNAAIAARVKAGETLQSIADEYDITRERVRQLAKRAGVISDRNKNPAYRDPVILAKVESLIYAGHTLSSAFKELDVSPPSRMDLADRLPLELAAANRSPGWDTPERRATFERVVLHEKGSLRQASAACGISETFGGRLARRYYPALHQLALSRHHEPRKSS